MSAPRSPAAVGSSTRRHAASFVLEDLPEEATELLAKHTSSQRTPAACLLPLVCRRWQAVFSRVQLLVDIHLELPRRTKIHDWEMTDLCSQQPSLQGNPTATAASVAAAAVAPAPQLWGGQLPAWLAKHRGSVRSLSILSNRLIQGFDHVWEQDLASICHALTAPQQGPAGGAALPHLVQLELPVLGLAGSNVLLGVLAACTGLQQLTLKQARGRFDLQAEGIDMHALVRAVAPLTSLRALHMEWQICMSHVEGGSLAGLLRALPPSLEDMQLKDVFCLGSIPLSCVTHLVNLRAWESPSVGTVQDNRSHSSSSSSSSAAALTALTRLHVGLQLDSSDARLQLPHLRALEIEDMQHVADPAVLEQLQGMPRLQQLSVHFGDDKFLNSSYADMLGGWTRLQQLQLHPPRWYARMESWKPWVAAVARLTSLTAMQVPGPVVVVGGSALLSALGQLKELTVDCIDPRHEECTSVWAQEKAASMADDVVQVVAAAVQGGKGSLQRLVLAVGVWLKPVVKFQQAVAAAKVAMPMLKVEAA